MWRDNMNLWTHPVGPDGVIVTSPTGFMVWKTDFKAVGVCLFIFLLVKQNQKISSSSE